MPNIRRYRLIKAFGLPDGSFVTRENLDQVLRTLGTDMLQDKVKDGSIQEYVEHVPEDSPEGEVIRKNLEVYRQNVAARQNPLGNLPVKAQDDYPKEPAVTEKKPVEKPAGEEEGEPVDQPEGEEEEVSEHTPVRRTNRRSRGKEK